MYSSTIGFTTRGQRISPHECGLAIAIPLDKDTFALKLDREEEGNFAQAFSAERRNLSVDGLWRLYEPYATFTQTVAVQVRALGVSVVLGATLDHFASLLSECTVTALVAQWRSALFRPADITDPVAMLAQMSQPSSPLVHGVNQFASLLVPATTDDSTDPVGILNKALLFGLEIPTGETGREPHLGAITRFQWELHRRRNILAAATGLQGGAGVEFADGFRAVDEIVARFPTQFSGLVDLTVCNSVLLAESIRRARPDCMVLANEDLAYLDFRLATYAQVIRGLSIMPEPYEDAVYRIRKHLQEVGLNEAKGRISTLLGVFSALWREVRRRKARSGRQ